MRLQNPNNLIDRYNTITSATATPGFASESGLVGHLHHHLIQKLYISCSLRLLVHAHDVRPLPLHLDHTATESCAGEVQSHLYACLALEGEVRAPLWLLGEGVFDDGDA